MTLGGQVVDLVGLHLLDHVDQAGGVGHVAVVKHQAALFLVGILVEVVDAIGVQQGSAALDAVHFIPLLEKELGEIGAILTGDAGDQSSFQEGSSSARRLRLSHFMPEDAPRRVSSGRRYPTGILTETMAAHESQGLPKRLLHVVASFAPAAGGTTEGIRRLAESGVCAVEVVCLDDAGEAYVQGQSFPVHALGPARGNYRYTPRLQPWLAGNLARFDGVVIHGLWQYHSYGSYRVVRGRVPYVVFPHGMLDPYFKRAFPLKHVKKQVYWLAREYRVLRDARAVCFTTPIERDSAAGTMWPQRWNPVVVSFGTSQPAG